MKDFIPVLSRGSHATPEEGACIMEMVSYMSGDRWTDSPSCTSRDIASVAQATNDNLPSEYRSLILTQFDRLFGTSDVNNDAGFMYKVANYLVDDVMRGLWQKYGGPNDRQEEYITSAKNLALTMSHVRSPASLALREGKITREEYAKILVGILGGVLDIYDQHTGRTSVKLQDINKLAELPCQLVTN